MLTSADPPDPRASVDGPSSARPGDGATARPRDGASARPEADGQPDGCWHGDHTRLFSLLDVLTEEYRTTCGSLPEGYEPSEACLRESDEHLIGEFCRWFELSEGGPFTCYQEVVDAYRRANAGRAELGARLAAFERFKRHRLHDAALEAFYRAVHGSPPRAALCLSGGGIRSATFTLGVLQGLASCGILDCGILDRFHYLSTVSGGGYIGSWLMSWAHRHPGGITGVAEPASPRS